MAGLNKPSFSCFLFSFLSFLLSLKRMILECNQQFYSGVRFKEWSHASCILYFPYDKEKVPINKAQFRNKGSFALALLVSTVFFQRTEGKKTLCEFFYYYFCRKNDWLASSIYFSVLSITNAAHTIDW